MQPYEKSPIEEKRRTSVCNYSIFQAELNNLLHESGENWSVTDEHIRHLLNGAASEALIRLIDKKTRTSDGIFFSGQDLAKEVAKRIKSQIESGATIADPTCGAGDLLLACMNHASIAETPRKTIAAWNKRIIGIDIHPQFVEAAKSRLALLALAKTKTKRPHQKIDSLVFPQIQAGDFLKIPYSVTKADCVVMNPPFGETDTPRGCSWSSGKVQQAALFVMSVVQNAKSDQHIVAVLPDVLRCGTRYARWRKLIGCECEIVSSEIYGRFDTKTDVDVFILHLKKRQTPMLESTLLTPPKSTEDDEITKLEDVFSVSVGSVVPHRHKGEKGNWAPYLTVHGAPIDKETVVTNSRRFDGRLHKTPFVTLRRTSSPGDARRAVPSLISGPEWIAVENHLIVVQPNDGAISTCRAFMHLLQDTTIDKWLDTAIRCRHLTTSILKQMPLIGWTR